MSEKLVSDAILKQRIADLKERVAAQRNLRADDDPFFKHAAWMLAEWEEALRDAGREYKPTTEAAVLTGWHEGTLRKWGNAVLAGQAVPREWQGLLVTKTDGGMAFCVSSIPIRGQAAA